MGIRTCSKCGITSDIIRFYDRKMNGKVYKYNICWICRIDDLGFNRRKYYQKNRRKEVDRVIRYNKANRPLINKRMKKYRARKKALSLCKYWSM